MFFGVSKNDDSTNFEGGPNADVSNALFQSIKNKKFDNFVKKRIEKSAQKPVFSRNEVFMRPILKNY